MSTGDDNDDLVDNLVEADYIKTPLVERLFRAVDRAHYYLLDHRESAYKDLAWKHEHLHLSAPCIYSEVMEALQLEPGLSFLNLGSGTGYLSTMVGLVLGLYGVNHGVEQHADVVEYAEQRLAEFKKNSRAFDEFDFCEPKFIVGNCLQLNPACQLYDRVYVGAGCPLEHENYMKNLIKIGGVLVMPLNDRLIQAKRISQTKWDIKNKLPVSFATLVSPVPDVMTDLFNLPEHDQPSLKEICRSTVRRVLRNNIHRKHPHLCTIRKRPKRPKKKVPHGDFSKYNILPFGQGMMILHNMDHHDHIQSDTDSDGNRVAEDEEGARGSGDFETDNSSLKKQEDCTSENDDDNVEKIDEIELDKAENVEAKCSSDGEDEASSSEKALLIEQHGNKTESEHGLNEFVEKESIFEDLEKLDKSNKSGNVESDYETDEDGGYENMASSSANEATFAYSKVSENERKANRSVDRLETMMSSISDRPLTLTEEMTAPESLWSDTDEEDDDINCNFAELLSYEPRKKALSSKRKIRYSSNTSVDTSSTSGIGSYNEEQFEKLGQSDCDKTSPESNYFGANENLGKKRTASHHDDDSDNVSDEELSKVTLSQCLTENIHSLPLPATLKSYLMYYRDVSI